MQPDSILILRSKKAQLEVGLIYLKRRHGELQRQLVAAEGQAKRGSAQAELIGRLQSSITDHAIQIEHRSLEIKDLDERIQSAQTKVERSGAQNLTAENDALTAEIGEVREQILAALRQLAEPLRRYESLAEKKNQITTELSTRTGRSLAYVNYIEGALFRQSEYVDDVRYTVESLRRQRVVA
jgi:chromosome segregation ATPase